MRHRLLGGHIPFNLQVLALFHRHYNLAHPLIYRPGDLFVGVTEQFRGVRQIGFAGSLRAYVAELEGAYASRQFYTAVFSALVSKIQMAKDSPVYKPRTLVLPPAPYAAAIAGGWWLTGTSWRCR